MNKRRIFGAFLMIIALLVMLIPAAEADAETSASAFSIKSGELVKYKGKDSVVSVPDTVTVIGEGAFEDNIYVERIILPDSVKQIKAYAFWGCDNLKTVTLGKGLDSVGDFAFTNCTGLESMKIPSNVHSIGIQAFAECKRFEDITIPPEVFDIREDAFDGDYLLNIHCEEGSYADKYAQDFYERQKNMTVYGNTSAENDSTIQSPSGVPADGVYSGADVQGQDDAQQESNTPLEILGEVFGSTTVVGNSAVVFMQNAGLPVQGEKTNSGSGKTEVASDFSNEITKGIIPERAHYRDEDLKELVFDGQVVEISQFAYARSGLCSVTLPQGLEKIAYAAFYHCDDLKQVEIPDSVVSVGAKAFSHTAWVEDFLTGSGEESGQEFLISGGVLVAYRGDAEEVVVPEGVRVIGGEAFADHAEIRKVTLPSTLTNIDERAFAGCEPDEVIYTGDVLTQDVIEESVSLHALGQAPEERRKAVPYYIWITAAALFMGGVFCIFKERY